MAWARTSCWSARPWPAAGATSVVLSVKFGGLRGPDGAFLGYDARPAATKNFLAHSLSRLGVDHIDIYRPSRLDPAVPIEETIGAIADMVKAGYVRYIGLSEVGAETIRRRRQGPSDLRSADRIFTDLAGHRGRRSSGPARTGNWSHSLWRAVARPHQRPLEQGPCGRARFSRHQPAVSGENLDKNLTLVEKLRDLARAKNITVAQLAIAWVLAQGDDIVPLVGARTRERLAEALGALEIELTPADLAEIARAVPADAAAGERYDAHQMRILDSEKPSQ